MRYVSYTRYVTTSRVVHGAIVTQVVTYVLRSYGKSEMGVAHQRL